eukprot:TRINITY_DN7576_c0_g1_i2.p1 TRINITY_DN7576_c0_g1~~TRINITY_DN7576_c0_g1_i2.p1  ORF type:complete len:374 (+),score=91.45 TRINITY_DN7576_c0_g1_i2:343-1464(+)
MSSTMNFLSESLDLPTPKLRTPKHAGNGNLFFPDDLQLEGLTSTTTMKPRQPETPPLSSVLLVTPHFLNTGDIKAGADNKAFNFDFDVSMAPNTSTAGSFSDLEFSSLSSTLSLDLQSPLIRPAAAAQDISNPSRNLYPDSNRKRTFNDAVVDLDPSLLSSAFEELQKDGTFTSVSAGEATATADKSTLSFNLPESFMDPQLLASQAYHSMAGNGDPSTSSTSSDSTKSSDTTSAPPSSEPTAKRSRRVTRASVTQNDTWTASRNSSSSEDDDEEYYQEPSRRRRGGGRRKSSKGGTGNRRVENMSEEKRRHIRKLARAAAKRRKDKEEALWRERAERIKALDDRKHQLMADMDDTQAQINALLQAAKAQAAF